MHLPANERRCSPVKSTLSYKLSCIQICNSDYYPDDSKSEANNPNVFVPEAACHCTLPAAMRLHDISSCLSFSSTEIRQVLHRILSKASMYYRIRFKSPKKRVTISHRTSIKRIEQVSKLIFAAYTDDHGCPSIKHKTVSTRKADVKIAR